MSAQAPPKAFRIHGMDCAEEVAVLKRELSPLVGGAQHLGFDILNAKLVVREGGDATTSAEIVAAVARTGMRAEPWVEGGAPQTDEAFWTRQGRKVMTLISGTLGALGFGTHALAAGGVVEALGSEGMGVAAGVPPLSVGLYSLSILAGSWYVAPKAWHALRRMRPDMNLLMVIALTGAALIGEWFEAATVAFLFAVSLLLESWSVARARRAVAALMDLTPATARMVGDDGDERLVPPGDVAIGARFIVRPAEKIPLDGRVVVGNSEVDQAPITGESVPVEKRPGADVFAGTINGDGVLEVECTKRVNDTTLAQIIRMVGEAQSRRAPSEVWVERFARIYTPAVMALAAGVFLVPGLFLGGVWSDGLYRALVLLVIACPCALVISTPVSVVASLAAAARNGVLIKGGEFVEAPARLKAIAMDKTGTLTRGEPTVVDMTPYGGHDEAELMQRAAALEAHSNHPLARAIIAAANERGVEIPKTERYEIIRGKGASGSIDGRDYWVGSRRYLQERGQETAEVSEQLEAMQEAGRTVVVVGNDQHVCGFITLTDSLRPAAAKTVSQFRAAGIEHVVMLTGDNEGTARVIAAQAGVDEVQAELLPGDKVAAVEALVARYGQVAMIGDGVNDAPALACASLGIAMGAAGSDAAVEVADIALMSDELDKLPWLIHHSRRTLRVIRQNIVFALTVKAAFVVLTFAGVASLWTAIAADMGASLVVIFNGLRLLRVKTTP